MRPDRDTGLTVESNLQGERIEMGIARGAMNHIMGILTDLYPEPVVAVVREYSTNAWDAHVEAGVTEPIRVTLPSALSPTFSVQDFGVGLNADDIRAIYSQYGASTKRETNDASGMLGLGCKSGLAFTDQFNLVGIKDGTKTVAAVSRDETGIAEMKIVSETTTDERNGVTVSIPADGKHDEFREAAVELFQYWAQGTVLVDEREPERIDGFWMGDNKCLADYEDPGRYRYDADVTGKRHTIVQGNVPYPIPKNANFDNLKIEANKRLVVWVPIGTVHFTPARDSLQDTAKTQKALAAIKEEYVQEVIDAVQVTIDTCKTKPEVFEAIKNAADTFPKSDFAGLTWRGKTIPHDFGKTRYTAGAYRRKYDLGHGEIGLLKIAKAQVVVENFTNSTWAGSMLDKLTDYMKAVRSASVEVKSSGSYYSYTPPSIVLYEGKAPNREWISNLVSWTDVRKWQPPPDPNAPPKSKAAARSTGTYPVSKGSYRVYDWDADTLQQTIDAGASLVLWEEAHRHETTTPMNEARDLSPVEVAVVRLAASRVDKFKRDFPKVQSCRDYVTTRRKRWWGGLSDDAKRGVILWAKTDLSEFSELSLPLSDPKLLRIVKAAKAAEKHRRAYQQAHRHLPSDATSKVDAPSVVDVQAMQKKYPLVLGSRWNSRSTKHTNWYLNAVDTAARNGEAI